MTDEDIKSFLISKGFCTNEFYVNLLKDFMKLTIEDRTGR